MEQIRDKMEQIWNEAKQKAEEIWAEMLQETIEYLEERETLSASNQGTGDHEVGDIDHPEDQQMTDRGDEENSSLPDLSDHLYDNERVLPGSDRSLSQVSGQSFMISTNPDSFHVPGNDEEQWRKSYYRAKCGSIHSQYDIRDK